jgi:flagellar basal-body rod protein FlgB
MLQDPENGRFLDLAGLASGLLGTVEGLVNEAERMERLKVEILQDATIEAMGSYMTRLSKRQQVVASNIANIDTPGYKTKDISFYATMEELLSGPASGLKGSRPEHQRWNFAPAEPEVFEVGGLVSRPDQNNVDIDREMLKLGQTSFGYSAITQLLRSKFRTIASSINEGRVG